MEKWQLYQKLKFLFHRAYYYEIYNEKVYDLLNDRKEFKLTEQTTVELKFEGGTDIKAKEEIIQLIDNGNKLRRTAETKMNVQSSRSHAVLQIVSTKRLKLINENKLRTYFSIWLLLTPSPRHFNRSITTIKLWFEF